jgi:hypothetical protein
MFQRHLKRDSIGAKFYVLFIHDWKVQYVLRAATLLSKRNVMSKRIHSAHLEAPIKKILLVDHHDSRRDTRIQMFAQAGYDVETREDYFRTGDSKDEATFDLVIVALHRGDLADAAAYSERLRNEKPDLPILLLSDAGVFVPRHVLSQNFEAGHLVELLAEIAEILGSTVIHELPPRGEHSKAA